ncbi:MAG: L-aspartate oxidase [Chloroherpetonaceae bacterium]|nr:L-aspartate oxidase [Chthonomonadaceae bacterium]MDW8208198.1 L-aspartate oxidase [Chloroherpetonaceae bacterium]
MIQHKVDYLVIGSGLAGLTYALQVARHGCVAVLTKRNRTDANSSWAQGGIAGALADDDSFELHKQDTLVAGAGLCNEQAVEVLVSEGPERIRDLIRMGARFDTRLDAEGRMTLDLGREGGHSRNRIVHTADFTGWECERTLLQAVRQNPGIQIHEHLFVTDLTLVDTCTGPVCAGAQGLDTGTGQSVQFYARATLLATGGCGHVYQHTTNPLVATGDGVAMAWRAGARIANMEFIQFHPTTLYHPEARAFLITEALRGEGGILRHADGEAFMERYHPLRELAPRDVVARAIVNEIKRRDVPCVYLDVTHLDPVRLRTHFPTVYERCLSVGIDITREPIPIVPAQHYQCGGVVTDLDGATDIPRLYAAGEVACTGVHGANRLASNSLLEAMVFGYRAAQHTLRMAQELPPLQGGAPEPDSDISEAGEKKRNVTQIREQIQKTMQRNAGIVRCVADLQRCLRELEEIQTELEAMSEPYSVEYWETRNTAQVAWLIVRSALMRRESRGLHYVLDYPEPVEAERHDTVLCRCLR